jgi:hypothetical protein
MTGDNILDQLQADTAAILAGAPALADVAVIVADAGDIEQKILRALGPLNQGSTGKSGLCLVVLPPEITDAQPNLPGPAFNLTQQIQVIEAPLINRVTEDEGGTGTGIRSAVAALRVLSALHQVSTGDLMLYADGSAITPLEGKPGFVSHAVSLRATTGGLAAPRRVARPTAAVSGGNLLLACATTGAAIYYTTDGTFPSPANPDAILYTGPITGLEDGDTVRAAAFLADYNPSDCIRLTVTIPS